MKKSVFLIIVIMAAGLLCNIAGAQNQLQKPDEASIRPPDPTAEMFFIPGWHFDPMWWNTQQHYLEDYASGSRVSAAFDLIKQYLQMCRVDKDYAFIVEQLPYLKPYWDVYPEDRKYMRELMAAGRLDVVGGSYNEPQTTMIGAENTIRNIAYGMIYQNEIMGGKNTISLQTDVFGHDPNFPQFTKRAGHTESAWARGPFHEWGFDRAGVNFPTEFFWTAPDGSTILTHYMSGFYGYGRQIGEDEQKAGPMILGMYNDLRRTALTPKIMLPMLDDFAAPNRLLGPITRKWNSENTSPKARIGTVSSFFEAVRKSSSDLDRHIPFVSRDFSPVFPGCAVSFTDTKQANRLAE
ncbi:MAG TPA: hypothetical protein PLQ76_05235, partial [bacterium]|nr:hypothetical protein [bacterium]